ncbi:MAG TPA: HAMP domain-containing sensor histidine kinase [Microlunatus sp.]|nr:HAMP domain-containing sensor histidine kinase [Microlunatus sp.]
MTSRLPSWLRTVRVRLALTYSALLFGITALLLAGVYLALSSTIDAAPLDPVTVKKFERSADGTIVYRPGEQFQAADLASVQKAVNFTALQTLRDYSIAALVIMFGLSLAIGWWVAGRALRPVEQITSTAREITATDLSRRIAATGPRDELRTLADTIDDMLGRLDGAFQAQRTLVEDVSHELRNPVAVIQANVEAVLGNEQSTPVERRDAAAVVTRATGRMSRLLDDLLATARKRSAAFVDREVDLAGLTRAASEEYTLLAAERALQLDLRLSSGPLVYADPESLNRALSNLLSNAVRLAPSGSQITVGVGSLLGWAWAAVGDQGPGIAEDERAQVFERFHRGATDETGGSGLGLAIARQIAESHDGRLVLADSPGPGSTFVIWLPERAVAGAPDRTTNPPNLDPLRA